MQAEPLVNRSGEDARQERVSMRRATEQGEAGHIGRSGEKTVRTGHPS